MSIYKFNNLEGVLLDRAVALAENIELAVPKGWKFAVAKASDCVTWPYGPPAYCPSVDWSQGGPIIERDALQLAKDRGDYWSSRLVHEDYYNIGVEGKTALIAAMRCYVRAKFGETVELP